MFREKVELRDYLEKTIQAGEARLGAQIAAAEKALSLQAAEYERRLTLLNHAHEQAREKERDFIQRETYEAATRNFADRLGALETAVEAVRVQYVTRDFLDARLAHVDDRLREMGTQLDQINQSRANLEGRLWMAGSGFTAITVIINLALNYWRSH